jgi:RHS repeat-associated protein
MSYTVRNQLATETRYSDLAGTQTVGYSTLTYDAESRLINLDHQNGSGTNLANYTYGYDLANRLTTETLNGGTPTTYSYDKTNQLTNDSQVAYTYDLNGNRTMAGYGTRGNNELTSDPTYGTYLYDAEGNMTGRTNKSTGEVWSFGYDNMDHMISAKDVSSTGTTLMLATYVYDVFGNRIEKDVWQTGGSTTTTRLAWDNPVDPSGLGGRGNIWADLNSSNGLVTRYILGDNLDQLIARISSSGTAAWFLTDRLSSVRSITDNSGSIIDTITYDGFGNITNESQSSNGGRFKWTAREADTETGLQFNRARYYDPKTGRWTSQDPLAFDAGDGNLYRYVKNNSPNNSDPLGLWETKDHRIMTERAVDAWGRKHGIPPEVVECIKTVVVRSNIYQDDIPSGNFSQLEYHYNRPFVMQDDLAEINKQAFLKREQEGKEWDEKYEAYLQLQAAIADSTRFPCITRLEALGRLTHAWQDFYGHAIRLDQKGKTHKVMRFGHQRLGSEASLWPGFSAFADPDTRFGTPDIHPDFIPSSYNLNFFGREGEHPTFREPLKENSEEYKARYQASQKYTNDKVDEFLTKWYEDCKCACEPPY